MNEHSPCDHLIQLQQDHARTDERQRSDHSWIEDIHQEHETMKTDLAKIKTTIALIVALATLIANTVFDIGKAIFPSAIRTAKSAVVQDAQATTRR